MSRLASQATPRPRLDCHDWQAKQARDRELIATIKQPRERGLIAQAAPRLRFEFGIQSSRAIAVPGMPRAIAARGMPRAIAVPSAPPGVSGCIAAPIMPRAIAAPSTPRVVIATHANQPPSPRVSCLQAFPRLPPFPLSRCFAPHPLCSAFRARLSQAPFVLRCWLWLPKTPSKACDHRD